MESDQSRWDTAHQITYLRRKTIYEAKPENEEKNKHKNRSQQNQLVFLFGNSSFLGPASAAAL